MGEPEAVEESSPGAEVIETLEAELECRVIVYHSARTKERSPATAWAT
jgi:hypothetical protein